jgi:hypothetical protein
MAGGFLFGNGIEITVDLQAHLHILQRGEAAVEIVRLKNEAEPFAQGFIQRRLAPKSSWPRRLTEPCCTSRRQPIRVSTVVLPEPDGPISTVRLPRLTLRSTS